MNHLAMIFLLFLLLPSYAGEKPTIALLEVHSLNVSPDVQRIAGQSARFELEKTGLFRVLTLEEMQERFQQTGENLSSSCLTRFCFQSNASLLKADVLLTIRLLSQEGRIRCLISLRSGATGEEVEHIQLSIPETGTQDISKLVRVGVADLLGTETRIDRKRIMVQVDTLQGDPRYSHWASGALLFLSGFATAGYFVADKFLQHDANTQRGGFYYVDTTIALSGIPGFFALPPANARYRAMSGAGVSLNGSAGKGMTNPAGLCGSGQQELTFSTARLPAESGSQFQATWSSPFRPGIWWSQEASMAGDELASEMIFKTTLAWDFSMLSAWMTGIQGGLSLKGLVVQAGQGGEGMARSTGQGLGGGVDLGLQWQIWDGPRLGLLLQDPFTRVRYSNTLTNRRYTEDLPLRLSLGASWETSWKTLIAADLNKASMVDQHDHFRLGFEQSLFEFLSIRAGLHQVLGTPIKTWSLGGGIRAQADHIHFQIHFAYESGPQQYSLLAGEQIFTLALEF